MLKLYKEAHHRDGHEDGVRFVGLVQVTLSPPTDQEVARLTQRIARRLTALARRLLGEDDVGLLDSDKEEAVLHHDLACALTPLGRGPSRWPEVAPSW